MIDSNSLSNVQAGTPATMALHNHHRRMEPTPRGWLRGPSQGWWLCRGLTLSRGDFGTVPGRKGLYRSCERPILGEAQNYEDWWTKTRRQNWQMARLFSACVSQMPHYDYTYDSYVAHVIRNVIQLTGAPLARLLGYNLLLYTLEGTERTCACTRAHIAQ